MHWSLRAIFLTLGETQSSIETGAIQDLALSNDGVEGTYRVHGKWARLDFGATAADFLFQCSGDEYPNTVKCKTFIEEGHWAYYAYKELNSEDYRRVVALLSSKEARSLEAPSDKVQQPEPMLRGKSILGNWKSTSSEILGDFQVRTEHTLSISRMGKGDYRYVATTSIVNEAAELPEVESSEGRLTPTIHSLAWPFLDGGLAEKGGYLVVPEDLWEAGVPQEITVRFSPGLGQDIVFRPITTTAP